jgi:hypothetical protein
MEVIHSSYFYEYGIRIIKIHMHGDTDRSILSLTNHTVRHSMTVSQDKKNAFGPRYATQSFET